MNQSCITLGSLAALLISGPASAALVDILFIERTDFTDVINGDAVQAEYDTGQYRVFRIVAVFDHPDDEFVGGIGTPDNPLILEPCPDSPIFQAPYDLNSDFIVNVFDLLELLSNWGTDDDGALLAAPFNIVDVSDLLVLLEHWGEVVEKHQVGIVD